MNKKIFISFVLSAMVMLSVSVSVFAEEAAVLSDEATRIEWGYAGKNCSYHLYSDGTLKITGHDNAEIDADNLRDIDKEFVVKLVIEDNIWSIGHDAFDGFSNLKSVTMSDDVYQMFYDTFASCRSLEEIYLSKNINYIGSNAFRQCVKLKSIDIPDNITVLESGTFTRCESLTMIEIPKKVITIADGVFSNCEGLKSITIPEHVTSIGESAFYSCDNLEEIYLSENITAIGPSTFESCKKLKEIHIPDGVTSIGKYAFQQCLSLKTVTIPEGVTTIGIEAFDSCENLQVITIPGSVISIGADVFLNCDENLVIHCEEGSVAHSYAIDNSIKFVTYTNSTTKEVCGQCGNNITWTWNTDGILILNGTGKMPEGDYFSNIKGATTEVIINEGITSISSGVFSGFINLEKVVIPESLEIIGNYAFQDCENLKTLSIPKAVENIGNMAFSNCADEFLIRCYYKSCAHDYALMNDIHYELFDTPVQIESRVSRISGSDRNNTSYKVADALKEELGIDKFDTVIIATGKGFADALSGSYLAYKKDSPILLTNSKDKQVPDLYAYIAKNFNSNGQIYILGGSDAVSNSVEVYLKARYKNVERLSGNSRYDTSLAILNEAGMPEGTDLIVATGKTFADSLSASAVKRPILLVKPNSTLTDEQKAIVKKARQVYIVGGYDAVTDVTENALKKIRYVERIAGDGRQETSKLVAEKFFSKTNTVVLAKAMDFPDGLCGGALAAAMDAPLLLTRDNKSDIAENYVQGLSIKSGIILGGTDAILNQTIVDVFGLKSVDEIYIK